MRRSRSFPWILFTLITMMAARCDGQVTPDDSVFTSQESKSTASFRGLAVVNSQVAWVSGSNGTVLRTTDGGRIWVKRPVDGASELDFRDITAFNADEALVIRAGAPAVTYLTEDGGETWRETFRHPDPRAFFNAVSFWDRNRGIAFSDPVDNRLLIIMTANGGASWRELSLDQRPQTFEGEAGFAASGTCLAVGPSGHVWVGLGGDHGQPDGNPAARVLKSSDFGRTWEAFATPIGAGQGSGVFSIAMPTEEIGVAVGGDYLQPEQSHRTAAYTRDGGRTWESPTSNPKGYRSAVAVVQRKDQRIFVAVGTNGCDASMDDGKTWQPLNEVGLHAVAFASDGLAGWACGAEGRIMSIDMQQLWSIVPQ